MIIIEAKIFEAIEQGKRFPTFRDGLAVAEVIDAAIRSSNTGTWVDVPDVLGGAT